MTNKLVKIGFPAVMVVAAAVFYFSALEQVKTPHVSSNEGYAENTFNIKAKPYVGVKLPASDDAYVEVAAGEQPVMPAADEKGKTYFAPGSFDHKRMDKQAVRNQRMTAKAMERKELKIIEREIASDEIRVQELMQKGDSENATYLENLIAQKKARYDELKYQ